MEKVAIINELYFKQEKTLSEIAQSINTSISYISKVLRNNEKYKVEKERRKQENLQQRRKKQKTIIYANRKNKTDIEYTNMKKEHEQASKELSKHSILGKDTLRKWCSSAYNYNEKKKRYEFDTSTLLKPADFPMHIVI